MSRPKLDDDDEAELFSDVPVDESYLSESDLGLPFEFDAILIFLFNFISSYTFVVNGN